MSDKKGTTDLRSSSVKERIESAKSHQPVGGPPLPAMPDLSNQRSPNRHAGVQNQGAQQPAAPQTQSPHQGGGLSPETAEQLTALAEHNRSEAEGASPKEPEKQSAEVDDFEDDDFEESFRNRLNDFDTDKRRRIVESRLDDLDFDTLITHGELRQRVPIRKGFVPEFRSVSGDEDLFVKKLLGKERQVSDQYMLDKLTLLHLTCSLYALNGQVLPNHLDNDGYPNEEQFNAKFRRVARLPAIILADLVVNNNWFIDRVRSFLSVENIENF